jgi:NADH-quinone oxidoreductase subunit N
MSDAHLLVLSPYIALAATAVVVMLLSAFYHRHLLLAGVTAAGLAAAFGCVLAVAGTSDRRATALLRVNDLSLYFAGLLVVIALVVVALSYGYLARSERRVGDFYTLVVIATLGGVVLLASAHFASFFLGLEVLSVSLYGLIAYPRRRPEAVEAAFKYLVLAGTTSAFLLFGMAMVYAVTGTMLLSGLQTAGNGLAGWQMAAYRAGLALIFAGVGFKLALVPFHFWTPDVYQGGPAPVTAFLATASKAAVFVVLIQFLAVLDPRRGGVLVVVFTIVAYASMLAGNLLALFQQNLKRLLAYSSIAQLGYLTVALIASGKDGRVAVAFYLSVYALALLTAFGVIALLSHADGEPEAITQYRGLGHRRPLEALVLTVSLLSLAGIPLTAGFIGKFFIFRAGAGAALWGLLIVFALTSAMSLYYYLRVIITMFRLETAPYAAALATSPGGSALGARTGDRLAAAVVALLGLLTVVLGVYPAPLLRLIEHVASVLG